MQIAGMEKIVTGFVMLAIGLGIVIKSRSIAKTCRASKNKIFGEAKYDDTSEFIVKCGIILIGVVGILGGILQIYQYIG